jgi:hypothetical protein
MAKRTSKATQTRRRNNCHVQISSSQAGYGPVESEAARQTSDAMEGFHEVKDEGRSSQQGEETEE